MEWSIITLWFCLSDLRQSLMWSAFVAGLTGNELCKEVCSLKHNFSSFYIQPPTHIHKFNQMKFKPSFPPQQVWKVLQNQGLLAAIQASAFVQPAEHAYLV